MAVVQTVLQVQAAPVPWHGVGPWNIKTVTCSCRLRKHLTFPQHILSRDMVLKFRSSNTRKPSYPLSPYSKSTWLHGASTIPYMNSLLDDSERTHVLQRLLPEISSPRPKHEVSKAQETVEFYIIIVVAWRTVGRSIHIRCVSRVIYKHVRHQKVELRFSEGRVFLSPSGTYDDTTFGSPCFVEPSGDEMKYSC